MKTLLVIAGLDPSGGAGLLADARVAADHGVRVVAVVTALTVQDTHGVRAVHPVSVETVSDQLRALLGDVEVDAVKIGMLGDARIAHAVAQALAATRAPVVWDPVLLPSRGQVPLYSGPLPTELLTEVRVVTPNLDEAATLTGRPVTRVDDMVAAAAALRAAGAQAALIKGGHLDGPSAVDVLHDAERVSQFSAPRIDTGPMHGTGCVLSSAIACHLAAGSALPDAVSAAKAYLGAKLRAKLAPGRGASTLV